MTDKLKAPFPWFGGKSRVSDLVWDRFGRDIGNYVEPFFGSGAVLLGRGQIGKTETINDLDGFVANFWRAVKLKPNETAHWASWPVNEADLHARHVWLVNRREDFTAHLMGDPDYCDPKIAGWWVWGLCSWIAGGWCSGAGPWSSVEGRLEKDGDRGRGINRQLPHLGTRGQGINRQLPHLGTRGQGINRQLQQEQTRLEYIADIFNKLSTRMRDTRVCCGDWERVCGKSPTTKIGKTAVFLDPPYGSKSGRGGKVYAKDSLSVSQDCFRWAMDHQYDPKMLIALCGYEGEFEFPDTWECVPWKANGGYGSQGDKAGRANKHRERIWFSPSCAKP